MASVTIPTSDRPEPGRILPTSPIVQSGLPLRLPLNPSTRPAPVAADYRAPSKQWNRKRVVVKSHSISTRRKPKSPKWNTAKQVKLSPDASINDAIGAIVRACRNHWQSNLSAALLGREVEGVHQVRVGLRRFRVALTLFRDYLPTSQRAWLKADAKSLSEVLGAARDLDVFLRDLTQPTPTKSKRDRDVAIVLRAAKLNRARAHARVAATLAGERYRRFMARLDSWLTKRSWLAGRTKVKDGTTPAKEFARSTLNKRVAKICRRAKTIGGASNADLHALRIAIKKIRYGIEFFEVLLPAKQTARTGHLIRVLQESLGQLNDFEVSKRTLTIIGKRAPSPSQRAALEAGAKQITTHLKSLAKASRPKVVRIANRLRSQPAL